MDTQLKLTPRLFLLGCCECSFVCVLIGTEQLTVVNLYEYPIWNQF